VAHSLSAKKRIRQNVKRRMLNRMRNSTLRTRLRTVQEAFVHGTVADSESALKAAIRQLDREANRGTLHRNAAARRKSRLVRRLNALKAKASA
jgi:small subunit ribosomal protein S20